MEILKHGNVTKPIHRIECIRCGCVFQMNHNEFIDNTYYIDYTCDGREFMYFCPDCGNTIRFDILNFKG